jgi:hypothetical protein
MRLNAVAAAHLGHNLLYETIRRRFNFQGRLVGLDLEKNVAAFYVVADADFAVNNRAFFHCIAELRQPNLFGHLYALISLITKTTGILRYPQDTINFPLENTYANGIM